MIMGDVKDAVTFDVPAAVARLRAEYTRQWDDRGDPEVLIRQVEPALAVGIRDEHEFTVLLSALGWRDTSNRWGRVMGLEAEEEDDHG